MPCVSSSPTTSFDEPRFERTRERRVYKLIHESAGSVTRWWLMRVFSGTRPSSKHEITSSSRPPLMSPIASAASCRCRRRRRSCCFFFFLHNEERPRVSRQVVFRRKKRVKQVRSARASEQTNEPSRHTRVYLHWFIRRNKLSAIIHLLRSSGNRPRAPFLKIRSASLEQISRSAIRTSSWKTSGGDHRYSLSSMSGTRVLPSLARRCPRPRSPPCASIIAS